jgi:hypothetical protein
VVYPPPKKGPSALKIILIIIAIVVGLGIIAIGVVGYIGYKVVKSGHLQTSTQPVSAADMGVPLYPGAQQKGNVRLTIAGRDTITATFLTSDSKDQVIAYYQSNLDPSAKYTPNNNGGSFILDKSSGDTIVTVSQTPNLENGQTQIVIVHATKVAATGSQGGSTN